MFTFQMRESDSPFVDLIWSTTSDVITPEHFTSVADPQWEMVVTRQEDRIRLTLRGPESKASLAFIPQQAEFIGITFKLGVFMPHLPLKSLVDTGIEPPDASSRTFWLDSDSWQFPTYENADTFLARLQRSGLLQQDPVVQAVLQNQPVDFSTRTIQRRFVQATGLTPKSISQIKQAKQAVAMLARGVPIVDAALATDFYDQAHLTNVLRRLIGQTPSQILRANVPESALSGEFTEIAGITLDL